MIVWIWENAWWVIPATAYAIAIFVAWVFLGRSAAVALATACIGHLAFIAGGRRERSDHDARAKNIETKREDAYREIDDRKYDRSDASKRLRSNDY